ncbi:MAG: IS110 family transposase [Armatimonadota bacterium]
MTLYVGIDVAKRFHVAALVGEDGAVLHILRFANDATGYQRLRQLLNSYPVSETLVAMESTGHYGHALRDWLLSQSFTIHIFNPLKTNRFRDFYIQWHKNDERDAVALAHLLRLGERRPYLPLPAPLRGLRQLVRHRALLTQARARAKNQLRAILDEVFPEYQQVPLFSDLFGSTSLALLSHYPTPAHLAGANEAQLAEFLSQHSRGRVSVERAGLIRETARRSIGSVAAGAAYAPILPIFIAGYQALKAQVDYFTAQIEAHVNQMEHTLTTVPGIGPTLAATILSEIGDIQRFPSAGHLVAFCGLALSESQSGQSTPRRFLSRRGSARLRNAFYQAALVAVEYDPHLGAYYRRRVRQGLSKRRAVLSVARKLVRIVYALLKSGQPYQAPAAAD